jgi:hypothetical protein
MSTAAIAIAAIPWPPMLRTARRIASQTFGGAIGSAPSTNGANTESTTAAADACE